MSTTPTTFPSRSGALDAFRAGIQAIGPERRLLWVYVGLSTLGAIVESSVLYLVAAITTSLSADRDELILALGPWHLTTSLGSAAVVAIALLGTQLLVAYPTGVAGARLSSQTVHRSRTSLVQAYLNSSWEFRADDAEGHFQHLANEYGQRTEVLVQQVALMINVLLSLAALLAAAVVINPLTAFGALALLVVISAALRPLVGGISKGSLGIIQFNRTLSSSLTQTARVSQEIATFSVAGEVAAELDRTIHSGAKTLERIRFVSRFTPVLYQVVALGVVVGISGVLISQGRGGGSSYAAILLLLIRALAYGRQLQTASQTATEYAPYASLLESTLADLRKAVPKRGTRRIEQLETVELSQVTYDYSTGHPALRSVNLTIPARTAIGLTGPSGGGKSSIAQVLQGLRRPSSGTVRFNGIDLADLDPTNLSNLVAFVPQDNKLVHGTVADNVRFYRSGFTDIDIERAVAAAHLDEEIQRMPDGYATVIGPGARDLSGGQKQRLGIARALLARPQLLILDEPTSALDMRSETLIRDTLLELRGTTAMLIVAHRPATLEVCDAVFEVRDGCATLRPASEHADGAA